MDWIRTDLRDAPAQQIEPSQHEWAKKKLKHNFVIFVSFVCVRVCVCAHTHFVFHSFDIFGNFNNSCDRCVALNHFNFDSVAKSLVSGPIILKNDGQKAMRRNRKNVIPICEMRALTSAGKQKKQIKKTDTKRWV